MKHYGNAVRGKFCPVCKGNGLPNVQMVIRVQRKDGSRFIGCTNYPVCTHTEPLHEDVKMTAQGAPELPLPG